MAAAAARGARAAFEAVLGDDFAPQSLAVDEDGMILVAGYDSPVYAVHR